VARADTTTVARAAAIGGEGEATEEGKEREGGFIVGGGNI
jgi:hypothetical protein